MHISKKIIKNWSKYLLVTLVFVSSLFVLTPSISFAQSSGLVPCGGYEEDGSLQPDCDFEYLIVAAEGLIDFLLFTIAMPLAAICFMYAGYMYLTAGAKIGSVATAKKIFWNVLWGLVIALSAWLIINTVMVGLGVDDGTGEGETDLIYLEP